MSNSTITPPQLPAATINTPQTRQGHSLNWLQRFAKNKLYRWLQGLEHGQIRVQDWQGTEQSWGDDDLLWAEWQIHHPKFFSRLATQGSLGIAESYLQREWDAEDLTSLLRILCRNLHRMAGAEGRLAAIAYGLRSFLSKLDGNTLAGSRRHIAAHYDLSNELFELFLDPSLMYSCAYFEDPRMTLHEASLAKLDRVCRQLALQATDQLLEIGTGWGGLALFAAKHHGCQVTTTTISAAQGKRARQRFQAAGVTSHVRLLNTDYRQLSGQYDKVVSIEMIEAVGERHLDTYFRQCGQLLRPGGRLVLQAIVMPEQRYAAYRRGVDFIRQYIFPGGFLPSVAAMQEAVGRTSNLRLHSLEDISPHYARTLQAWRQRFLDHVAQVLDLGFDDRFVRMWEYYLCYCEAAFREQAVRVVQMAWDKPTC